VFWSQLTVTPIGTNLMGLESLCQIPYLSLLGSITNSALINRSFLMKLADLIPESRLILLLYSCLNHTIKPGLHIDDATLRHTSWEESLSWHNSKLSPHNVLDLQLMVINSMGVKTRGNHACVFAKLVVWEQQSVSRLLYHLCFPVLNVVASWISKMDALHNPLRF